MSLFWLCSLHEDFVVSPKLILSQWRARKLSHEQCVQDLQLARDSFSVRLIELVRNIQRMETEEIQHHRQQAILAELEAGLGACRDHCNIDEFLQKYVSANAGRPSFRFKFLLLRGRSRMGKSQKAMSLFGIAHTLVLNCQGLQSTLPSLRSMDRDHIRCIVFDEISAEQVLANKLVFQAGPWPVTLAQSACGQHAYSVNLYAMPMVCCSNDFKTSQADGLSEDAESWLRENMFEASPPEGLPWFWERSSSSDRPPLPTSSGC